MANRRQARGRTANDNIGEDEQQEVFQPVQHSPNRNVANAPLPPPSPVVNPPPAHQQVAAPQQPVPNDQFQVMLDMQLQTMRMLQQSIQDAQNQNALFMAELRANRSNANALLVQNQNVQQQNPPFRGQNPPIVQQARTHHLKTSDIRIPTYSGATDSKTPYDFIMELEKYQAVVGYTEAELMTHVVPLALTEDAYCWYTFEPPFQTWNNFTQRLRTEFQAIGYKEDLKRELDNRFQGTNEPLTAFIRIILDYYKRIGDPTEEQRQVAQIKRLMHPEYRKALVGMPSQTLADLKASAPAAQELIKNYRSYCLPPITGSLEPALAWKPIPKYNESVVRDASTAISLPLEIPTNASPPKLDYASVDPFAYFHAPKKEVKFQNFPTISRRPVPNSRESSPSRDISPGRKEMRCYTCNSLEHLNNQCPNRRSRSPTPSASRESYLVEDGDEMATIELSNCDKRPFNSVEMLGKSNHRLR